MRTHWLLLGMLIPIAGTLAVWDRESDAAASERGLAALYADGGAKMVTADVDALLEKGAPPSEVDEGKPRPAWLEPIAEWLPEPKPRDPLLIILVEGPERVAIARSGVSDERIAGESPGAFVVGDDRMVAGSRDAAAEMLIQFDWVERPLELFAVETKREHAVAPRGARNADVAAYPLIDGGGSTDLAQLHSSDRLRVERAAATASAALQ
jgi:hypothetical protein